MLIFVDQQLKLNQMQDKNNYSEEEWTTLSSLPQLTGLLMSSVTYSGVKGTESELNASINSIFDGFKKFPDNTLINSTVPRGKDEKQTLLKIKEQQEEFIQFFSLDRGDSLESFQKNTLDKYHLAIYYLSSKETLKTIKEFRLWILYIAEQVAIAAIEKADIKNGGEVFSEKEREIFSRIERRMDLNK